MECFGSSEKRNKILTGAIKVTKCRAETEVKATQRLPYLGIHPLNSHQTPTLLWTTRSVYQKLKINKLQITDHRKLKKED